MYGKLKEVGRDKDFIGICWRLRGYPSYTAYPFWFGEELERHYPIGAKVCLWMSKKEGVDGEYSEPTNIYWGYAKDNELWIRTKIETSIDVERHISLSECRTYTNLNIYHDNLILKVEVSHDLGNTWTSIFEEKYDAYHPCHSLDDLPPPTFYSFDFIQYDND